MDAEQTYEVILLAMRELSASMYADGLNPAQWNALRYFGRAPEGKCTVADFANFHATTSGTASNTVSSLENKNLVQRTRSSEDKRQSIIQLTECGESLLEKDPLLPLKDYLEECDIEKRMTIGLFMKDIIFRIYGEGKMDHSPQH